MASAGVLAAAAGSVARQARIGAPAAAAASRALLRAALSSSSSASSALAAEKAMPEEESVHSLPRRLLMSTGPSNTHPRALAAMSAVQVGHMHEAFYPLLDDIKLRLQQVLQTSSPFTMAISGGGHSAMEAMIANFFEEGDKMVVCVNGIWGERIVEIGKRLGVDVVTTRVPLGRSFSLEQVEAAVSLHKPKALFMCQGESSTGVYQSLEGVGDITRKHGALLMLDAVCTLGGVELRPDASGVDVMYSGAQKCLSAVPGASPFFMSERAMEALMARKSLPRTYNYDLKELGNYWNWDGLDQRRYHHTPPIGSFYALREALDITVGEGMENVWARHRDMTAMLWDGLRGLGLEPYVAREADRLVTVNTIKIPEGVDWRRVCSHAMETRNLEIGGGLGPTVGKVWRIGIMGHNARPENVAMTLEAFKAGLDAARA